MTWEERSVTFFLEGDFHQGCKSTDLKSLTWEGLTVSFTHGMKESLLHF